MKLRTWILLIVGCCLWACEQASTTTIEFCEELDEKGLCKKPAKTFAFGSKIYVSCHSTEGFAGNAMKGNIYFLNDGEKVYFNYKDFSISPGTKTVHTYIPFDQFGGKGAFYVEFVDENGEILGGNDLKIEEE